MAEHPAKIKQKCIQSQRCNHVFRVYNNSVLTNKYHDGANVITAQIEASASTNNVSDIINGSL